MVKVKFTLDRRTDEQTDRQGDSYIPPQTSFAGGIKIFIVDKSPLSFKSEIYTVYLRRSAIRPVLCQHGLWSQKFDTSIYTNTAVSAYIQGVPRQGAYNYMWQHRCTGGLKKKLHLRSGSQRHRNFVGFFKVHVLHRYGATLFSYSEKPPI